MFYKSFQFSFLETCAGSRFAEYFKVSLSTSLVHVGLNSSPKYMYTCNIDRLIYFIKRVNVGNMVYRKFMNYYQLLSHEVVSSEIVEFECMDVCTLLLKLSWPFVKTTMYQVL
jgi:hypothetical protein